MRPGIYDSQYNAGFQSIYDAQYFDGGPPGQQEGGGGGKGKGGHGGPRKRIVIDVDGQQFEVKSREDAESLLQSAREIAREQAQLAVARAAKAKRPEAKQAALELPSITLVDPDHSDELTQEVQAQVDSARADIERTYQEAIAAGDEEGAVMALMVMDDDDEEKQVAAALTKIFKALGRHG